MDEDDDEDEVDSEEEELSESTGTALNQRLMRAAAMRDQGIDVVMDPAWEQFLKEAQERGDLNIDIDGTREALRIMAGQLTQVNAQASSSAVAAVAGTSSASAASQSYPPAAA